MVEIERMKTGSWASFRSLLRQVDLLLKFLLSCKELSPDLLFGKFHY